METVLADIIADTDNQQSVIDHMLSKIHFSVGKRIQILQSNLNWNIEERVGYKKVNMKIGPKKDINKAVVYLKKITVTLPESCRD